jgi:phospholipid/cholesterol/gamma-HCH transport system substrate-binding protein
MKVETKVGLLFVGAVLMTVVFAYILGDFQIFNGGRTLRIAYNFAGGITRGSPVRVMGVEVGKVKEIQFVPTKLDSGEEVSLVIVISIDRNAWYALRKDSRFFINLAGVIGEKFIEITPGKSDQPQLEAGELVRGEDPPRIDQLISQSYSLAGKIIEIVEKNEGSVKSTIEMMDRLVTNLNKLLVQVDKTTANPDARKLLTNVVKISDDIAFLTAKTRTQDGERTMKLMNDLIWRLEPLDAKTIKKFLQEDGIRAKIF